MGMRKQFVYGITLVISKSIKKLKRHRNKILCNVIHINIIVIILENVNNLNFKDRKSLI